MLKKILKLGIMGTAIGITISIMSAIIISLAMYGTGYTGGQFYYTTPQFTQLIGSESVAALLNFILNVVYGFIVGATSYVWGIERLGLTKQTLIHYAVFTLTMIPMAVFLQWIPFRVLPILIFFVMFTVIYILIWLGNYLVIKHNIKKMNIKLNQ